MRLSKFTSAIIALVLIFNNAIVFAADSVTKGSYAKNVIILIADGMSMGGYTLSRWYQDGKPLAMDPTISALVRAHAADSAITDSAPAGTALATGNKSHTGFISVLADENTIPGVAKLDPADARKPVATVLEGAKLLGKSTGLISTSEVMHATPASFAAHYPARSNYDMLTEQMVYNNVDVVLGGGYQFFKERGDKEDLIAVLKSRGYEVITDRKELRNVSANKYYGLFAPKALANDFDRPENEPSLAEMTTKAIETLSKNEKGFFLMVEGSKVDWSAHANDPVGIVSEILAFDKAVAVALEYAKTNKDTVVIITTDHGNSGITIGDKSTTKGYDFIHVDSYIKPLKKANYTGLGIERFVNADKSNIAEVVAQQFGVTDLTAEELESIKNAKTGAWDYALGPIIAKRAKIGFTTGGHTGEDVILGVYAPDGIRPTGVIDNTDIAQYMANTLGVDFDKLNKSLFVNAKAFEKSGAKVTVDEKDKENPILVVTKNKKSAKFPINKSIALVNGKEIQLKGVTVFNTLDWYVSADALTLVD